MLKSKYLVAKIGVDRAENEPAKVSRKFMKWWGSKMAVSGDIRPEEAHQVLWAIGVAGDGALLPAALTAAAASRCLRAESSVQYIRIVI